MTGLRRSIDEYARVTSNTPMWNCGLPGGCGNVEPDDTEPLTTAENASRKLATPRVGTRLMILGALRSRRTTATAARAPELPDTTSARAKAIQYGKCHFTTARPHTAAPKAPIWP